MPDRIESGRLAAGVEMAGRIYARTQTDEAARVQDAFRLSFGSPGYQQPDGIGSDVYGGP
jgi:hypothetical protein